MEIFRYGECQGHQWIRSDFDRRSKQSHGQNEKIEPIPIIVQPIRSTLTLSLILGLIPDLTIQKTHKRVARHLRAAPQR